MITQPRCLAPYSVPFLIFNTQTSILVVLFCRKVKNKNIDDYFNKTGHIYFLFDSFLRYDPTSTMKKFIYLAPYAQSMPFLVFDTQHKHATSEKDAEIGNYRNAEDDNDPPVDSPWKLLKRASGVAITGDLNYKNPIVFQGYVYYTPYND